MMKKALRLLMLLTLTMWMVQACGSVEKCNCPGGNKSLLLF